MKKELRFNQQLFNGLTQTNKCQYRFSPFTIVLSFFSFYFNHICKRVSE